MGDSSYWFCDRNKVVDSFGGSQSFHPGTLPKLVPYRGPLLCLAPLHGAGDVFDRGPLPDVRLYAL